MEINPQELAWQSTYKLMIGTIIPRPIGWISTIDQSGVPNLAPFSFFTAASANPPTLIFCPLVRSSDNKIKDTLRNVRETGEFVVNIVTEKIAPAMVQTSAELLSDIDEFDFAKLEKVPSFVVRPPRVAPSPIHFECRVREIITISEKPGGGTIVIGDVVHIHVAEDVLISPDKVDPQLLQAVGRMGGPTYCRTKDLFDLPRPPSQI